MDTPGPIRYSFGVVGRCFLTAVTRARVDAARFRPAGARFVAAGGRLVRRSPGVGVPLAVVASAASHFGRGAFFLGAGAAAAASAACRASSVTSVVTG